jgi:hypothetical protein
MTVAYKARVWEVGTITGAGPYNLPNTANSGAWRTVAGSGLTSGQNAIFCLQDTITNAWELSLFTYTSGSPGTLTRVQFLESSTGSAITFAGNSTNITLEIPSPIVASAGTTSSGLVPALNTSGVLDSSFVSGGGQLSNYSNAATSGSLTFPNNPSGAALVDFLHVVIPASTTARIFEVSGFLAINTPSSGAGTLWLGAILDPGSSSTIELASNPMQGPLNTFSYGASGTFAGVIVSIPGDNASHTIALSGGQYGGGSGASATVDQMSVVAKQIS